MGLTLGPTIYRDQTPEEKAIVKIYNSNPSKYELYVDRNGITRIRFRVTSNTTSNNLNNNTSNYSSKNNPITSSNTSLSTTSLKQPTPISSSIAQNVGTTSNTIYLRTPESIANAPAVQSTPAGATDPISSSVYNPITAKNQLFTPEKMGDIKTYNKPKTPEQLGYKSWSGGFTSTDTHDYIATYYYKDPEKEPIILKPKTPEPEPLSTVREATITEKIGMSKPYQYFLKATEPLRLVQTGILGMTASGLGTFFDPIMEFGRNPSDTSQSGKIKRGILAFGKSEVLFSNPYTAIPSATYFLTSMGKSYSESPLGFLTDTASYIINEPYEFAGGLAGAKFGEKFSEISIKGKMSKQIIPSTEMKEAVEPFSRKRSTVLLKDESGNYLLGKTKTGEIISFGGKIERGESTRTAGLRELREETGIKISDIKDFKSSGKVVTPEETFHLFTGEVSNKVVNKITATSDIKEIVSINPKNLFIKEATGQTALQPISRITNKGRIRSYEVGIINYLETGIEPTWLSITTKGERIFLGTQSRYDVPFSSQKKYLGYSDNQFLIHGTSKPAIIKGKLSLPFKEKSFEIMGEMTKRGQAEGLYLQPPIKPGGEGYLGLSYLNFGKGSGESLGIKFGYPKRTAFLFKEKVGKEIGPTPKTFSGVESELIVNPGTRISTAGRYTVASIGLKKVRLQPVKIIKSGEELPINERIISSKELFESTGNYRYVTPGSMSTYLPSRLPSRNIKNKKNSYEKVFSDKKIFSSEIIKEKSFNIPVSSSSSSVNKRKRDIFGGSYPDKEKELPKESSIFSSEKSFGYSEKKLFDYNFRKEKEPVISRKERIFGRKEPIIGNEEPIIGKKYDEIGRINDPLGEIFKNPIITSTYKNPNNFKIKRPGTKKKRMNDNYTDYYFSEGFLSDIIGTEKIKLKDISKNIGIRSFGIRGIPKLIS